MIAKSTVGYYGSRMQKNQEDEGDALRVRVPAHLKKKLAAMAETDGRDLSNFVRYILTVYAKYRDNMDSAGLAEDLFRLALDHAEKSRHKPSNDKESKKS